MKKFFFVIISSITFTISQPLIAKPTFPLERSVAQWICDRFKEHSFTVIFKPQSHQDLYHIETNCYMAVEKENATTFHIHYNEATSEASYINPWSPFAYLSRAISPNYYIEGYKPYNDKNLIKAFALHELGHCVYGHPLVTPGQAFLLMWILILTLIFLARKAINHYYRPQSKKGYAGKLLLLALSVFCILELVGRVTKQLTSHYLQSKEWEADQFVIDYGDPVLIKALQETFEYWDTAAKAAAENNTAIKYAIHESDFDKVLRKLFITHPSNAARAENFKKAVKKLEAEKSATN